MSDQNIKLLLLRYVSGSLARGGAPPLGQADARGNAAVRVRPRQLPASARIGAPGGEHPGVHGCHTARPVDGLLGSHTASHRWPAAPGAGPRALRRLAGAARTTSQKTVANRALAHRRTGASQTEKSNAYVL